MDYYSSRPTKWVKEKFPWKSILHAKWVLSRLTVQTQSLKYQVREALPLSSILNQSFKSVNHQKKTFKAATNTKPPRWRISLRLRPMQQCQVSKGLSPFQLRSLTTLLWSQTSSLISKPQPRAPKPLPSQISIKSLLKNMMSSLFGLSTTSPRGLLRYSLLLHLSSMKARIER